jgi:hypothetical protein
LFNGPDGTGFRQNRHPNDALLVTGATRWPSTTPSSWETVTVEDFAELRKVGLTHPLMDEIEKRFSAGG